MVIGFAAVAIAVFYRLSANSARPNSEAVAIAVSPADLVSVSMGDGTIAFTIGGATPRVEVRRVSDGELVQTFALGTPAATPE
ncbi:hypothetical protein DLJ53_23155 [Acuticoccus sediminis]|uniref:Uncharacterized protein n=2 Tax=Acuticoccus sediminis TaxID=2184697 RepID=A0A8B2NIR8_9HYPH|nr:hypothetical protein DLJ53_23155 [Acuticoccus sediminis]